MNPLHLFPNKECHRVQFWHLFYSLCIHTLSVPSILSQVSHTISLQMIPSFTTQVFLQTFQLLLVVWKIATLQKKPKASTRNRGHFGLKKHKHNNKKKGLKKAYLVDCTLQEILLWPWKFLSLLTLIALLLRTLLFASRSLSKSSVHICLWALCDLYSLFFTPFVLFWREIFISFRGGRESSYLLQTKIGSTFLET